MTNTKKNTNNKKQTTTVASKNNTTKGKTANSLVIKNRNNSHNIIPTQKIEKNTIDLVKISDSCGVSVINKNSDIYNNTHAKEKNSKLGRTPLQAYGNSNYSQKTSDIFVVHNHDQKYYDIAINNALKLSKIKYNRAIEEYANDIERIQINKKKKMIIAKIESLRLINKAALLEKKHNQEEYEKQRHLETISNIKQLKASSLQRNEAELNENLARLSLEKEIQLSNNETIYKKALMRIDEQKEIISIKRKWKSEQIKVLSTGHDFEKKMDLKQIQQLKNNHRILEHNNAKIIENHNENIAHILKKLDRKNLSLYERSVIDKYLELCKKDNSISNKANELTVLSSKTNKYDERVQKNIQELTSNIKRRQYMIVDANIYNKVLDAKKSIFTISEDARKFANDQRSVSTMYDEKEFQNQESLMKSNKLRNLTAMPRTKNTKEILSSAYGVDLEILDTEIEDSYSKYQLVHTINKWKKIEKAVLSNDDYQITKIADGKYKIDYLTTSEKTKKTTKPSGKHQYVENYESTTSMTKSFNNVIKSFDLKLRNISSNKLINLINEFNQMYSKQLVKENKDVFLENGCDIDVIHRILNKINVDEYSAKSAENKQFIKNDVKLAFSIYKVLVNNEIKAQINIEKAQKLDTKLAAEIAKDNRIISRKTVDAEQEFNNNNKKITINNDKAINYTKDKFFINKEEILENDQIFSSRENEIHFNNVAWYNKQLNKLDYKQNKYESKVLNGIIHEVTKYNHNNPNTPIPVSNIPIKINPLALNNPNIKIELKSINNNIYATSFLSSCNQELFASVINTKIPNQVQKIMVLDKFRNVENIHTRIAMLVQLANTSYENAIKSINNAEKNQISLAKKKLDKKIKAAEKIRKEAEMIHIESNKMKIESSKYLWLEQQNIKMKHDKWKIADKNNKIVQKQLKLELKKVALENNKITSDQARKSSKNSIIESNHNVVKSKEIIGNNNNNLIKKPSGSTLFQRDNNWFKRINLKKVFALDKQNSTIHIDEIIGKKTKK